MIAYLAAKGLRPAQALLRLDALYGIPSPLARPQRAGLGFVARGRDYHLLDHPKVLSRLERPCDVSVRHPETRVRCELFEVGYIHRLAGAGRADRRAADAAAAGDGRLNRAPGSGRPYQFKLSVEEQPAPESAHPAALTR